MYLTSHGLYIFTHKNICPSDKLLGCYRHIYVPPCNRKFTFFIREKLRYFGFAPTAAPHPNNLVFIYFMAYLINFSLKEYPSLSFFYVATASEVTPLIVAEISALAVSTFSLFSCHISSIFLILRCLFFHCSFK